MGIELKTGRGMIGGCLNESFMAGRSLKLEMVQK